MMILDGAELLMGDQEMLIMRRGRRRRIVGARETMG
jgi:hypothetical protein